MRITIVQSDLLWEDIQGNLKMFDNKLKSVENTDLIILPEMFTTGFSMNAVLLAETMWGPSMLWMKKIATQKKTAITGSLIIKEGDQFFNRLIWIFPDGKFTYYDKKHLFTMAKEDNTFSSGRSKTVINYLGWKICPFICYDLRFPVWSRNKDDYDIALYVANWPDKRSYHWKSLLIARAIENQCYILAVNRVGNDGNGLFYSGYSSVIDPSGEIMYQKENSEDIKTLTIEKEHLNSIREKLPFLKDRD